MRLFVAVVDGTSSDPAARPWLTDDLVLVGVEDVTALAAWSDEARRAGATHVAVLTRPDTERQARLMTTVAVGRHPAVAYAVVVQEASLLALAASGMTVLESSTDPDQAVARLQSMLETTHSGVWLKRVGRLKSPQPGFGQHLRSLLPGGGGYVAVMRPAPRVLATAKAGVELSPHPSQVLCGDEAESPAGQALGGAFAVDVNPVTPVGSVEKRYGSSGAEYACLGTPDALSTRTCPTCRLDVAHDICPFCRVRLDADPQETE